MTPRVWSLGCVFLTRTKMSTSGWVALCPHRPVAVACGPPWGLGPAWVRPAPPSCWAQARADAAFWVERLCRVAFRGHSGQTRRSQWTDPVVTVDGLGPHHTLLLPPGLGVPGWEPPFLSS